MTYSAEDRSLILAAVERFGETTALRFIKDNYALTPSRGIVHQWRRVQGLEASEVARTELNETVQRRKARLEAEIEPRVYAALEAFDRALDADKALAAQQLATATGILTDKLTPPLKPGGGVPLISSAHGVQILVAASPNPPGTGHRDVLPDWVEGELREITAPEDEV